MFLATGKGIHYCVQKELKISDDTIDRVNQLGADEGHPLVTTNFKFEWRIAGEDIETDKDINDDAYIEDIM